MSILFEPMALGNVEIKNRFVHSATVENMATEQGQVTEDLTERYRTLAKGDVGLIIPGNLYVHPLGRAFKYEAGIHSDEMIPGLKQVVDAVHEEGGRIVFQLIHAGRQTTKELIGQTPLGPSATGRDPINFVKPQEMTETEIQEAIEAFGRAAGRVVETGADGVQIQAAHGWLVSQFLSPFFNHRDDAWGGSDENQFRFLKEVVLEIRKHLPVGMPLLVKMNAHDYTPQEGITPPLAARYAGWLAELGIDGVEVSCGTSLYSFMDMIRGDVPVDEMVGTMPWWMKPVAWLMLKSQEGKYDLEEGYNLEGAKVIRQSTGDVPLMVVGGLRSVSHMEQILKDGHADFVSLSRPFIREPYLVKRLQEGKTDVAACQSCNKCAAALAGNMPVRCYCTGFPQ
jgi:2,4-dienoyl-CoA reductase-like NADH-dependent reductase (Old Yellow Enzyme family)